MTSALVSDSANLPAGLRTKAQKFGAPRTIAFEERTQLLRGLIWLYLILWVVEGGLRRWILPGLSTPLLFIRDPLVVTIYLAAFRQQLFPGNNFMLAAIVLGLLTFSSAMLVGHGNPLVAFYGLRCDFLHIPLIFIMGRVIRQKELRGLAKAAAWLALPNTLLLIAQFYSPQDAWVNRGVGGGLDGAGFSGALGRFRPPGTFSFITGTAELYDLLTAFWFVLVLTRKFQPLLMIASGLAILVAIPISVSRGLFLSVALVSVAGTVALLFGGSLSGSKILSFGLVIATLLALALQLPAFKAGMEAFGARWEASTTENGGFQEAILGRVSNDLFGSFKDAPLTGLGTGFSTNVGQKMLSGEAGFGASEGEWGRLIYDNGIVLGSLLIVFRISLAGSITLAALRAWRRGSASSIVFASAACLQLLTGQWGQSTALGSAVIAGGLALAAASEIASLKPKAKAKQLNARQMHRPSSAELIA